MSPRLLTLAAASLLPLSLPAAEMPKEGTDNNDSGQIKSDDKKNRGFVSNKVMWKLP